MKNKMKKIILLSLIPLSVFASSKPTPQFEGLVKDQVNSINENLMKNKKESMRKNVYVDSVKYKDHKIIYTYVARLKPYLESTHKMIPWKGDALGKTDPHVLESLTYIVGPIIIRNFKTTACFNSNSRTIIDKNIPMSMIAKWDNGKKITSVTATKESCKKYDKFRK